jgi:hypothetical protein
MTYLRFVIPLYIIGGSFFKPGQGELAACSGRRTVLHRNDKRKVNFRSDDQVHVIGEGE